MTTKLSEICDSVAELDLNDRQAEQLIALMRAWRADSPRTYRDLLRVPGFNKLWSALEEAAHSSARIEMEEPR